MALKGSRELRARLKAIRQAFKPIGKDWADKTVTLARSRVRRRSGKTASSIRVRNASQRKAAVQATHGARFLEAGTKPHPIQPRRMRALKFSVGGRTVFATRAQHRGMTKRPFLRNSAREVLERMPLLQRAIELWNKAA